MFFVFFSISLHTLSTPHRRRRSYAVPKRFWLIRASHTTTSEGLAHFGPDRWK
jgi:hypothetical protein